MVSQVGRICIEVVKKSEVNGVEKDYNFRFEIEMGCPLGVAYDACFDALGEIITMSKTAVDKADRNVEVEEEIKD